jgi:hypothetical protein
MKGIAAGSRTGVSTENMPNKTQPSSPSINDVNEPKTLTYSEHEVKAINTDLIALAAADSSKREEGWR